MEEAMAWQANGGLEGSCDLTMPFPTTFAAYESGNEATRTVAAHLNFPPYLEDATLGMEMVWWPHLSRQSF
ncbi:MAG: hypothetical protein OWT27_09975 [Firmicutes bacterium]|nr:hypothetical protein [Bacillota bacterium]